MAHDVFTLVAPVVPTRVAALRRRVNPAGDARQPIAGLPFARLPALHFASIVIFDAQTVREVPGRLGRLLGRTERTLTTAPRLVIECCLDGSRDELLDALVHAGGAALIDIFGHCLDFTPPPAGAPAPEAHAVLRAYLAAHVRRPHLLHIGNPGLTADHIRAGHALRTTLDARLDDLVRLRRSLDPPLFIADRLRGQLNVPPVAGAWHFAGNDQPRDARHSAPPPGAAPPGAAPCGAAPPGGVVPGDPLAGALPPGALPPGAPPPGDAAAWFDDPVSSWGARLRHWLRLVVVLGLPFALIAWGLYWLWATYGTLAAIAAVVAARVAGRLAQRWFKGRQPPPLVDPAHVRALKELEDFSVQNHMASFVVLAPGWIRKLRQRWVLGLFELLYRTIFTDITPGRLRGLQTIHFAHWTIVDLVDGDGRATGREALLFLSNYDGSWETYLDDFIAFLLGGVVSIWSNGEGFPWPLDGPTFKTWARGCMSPWDHWYQAYPALTVLNIENNDTIRRGLLATPRTELEARHWLLRLGGAHLRDESLLPVPGTLEARDIQGLVFSGYRRLPHATYVLLRIRDAEAARGWLASIARDVTDGRSKRKEELELERLAINVAFTHRGLTRLGLPADVLRQFPPVFQDGMAPAGGRHRSRALGDTGASDPAWWRWGHDGKPVDLLLMAYGLERAALAADVAARVHAFTRRAGDLVDRVDGGFLPTPPGADASLTLEHFGFADGVSQPVLEGTYAATRRTAAESQHLIKPGEFVLGYPAGDGTIAPGVPVDARLDPHGLLPPLSPQTPPQTPPPPASNGARHVARDFGRNGSYLVFRQLEQDVPAFRAFTGTVSGASGPPYPPASGARVAAQMVGRWRDGVPLTPRDAPGGTTNEFAFSGDAHGFACPIGSHVRRANPRDSLLADPASAQASANRHRLLRRGRPYGPPLAPGAAGDEAAGDEASRGMVFVCLNSDIERQFEFVQQNWINNPCFGGLYDERDPLVGDQPAAGGRVTLQADAVRERIDGIRRYVTVKCGSYFFLPGLSALRYLAHLEPEPRRSVARAADAAHWGSTTTRSDATSARGELPASASFSGSGTGSGATSGAAPAAARAPAQVPPRVQVPTLGFRALTRVASALGTLRLIWAARFPLLLAAAIACFPLLPFGARWLPGPGSFAVMPAWDLAIFSLVASLGAFVATIALRLVLLYGWRFDFGRPRWTGRATWLQVLACQAIALPPVLTSIHQAARAAAAAAGSNAGAYWGTVLDLAPLALLGGLGAIAILLIATSVQALWRGARPDLFFPPNPLFANLAGPGMQGARASRPAQWLARLGGWIVDSVPEEIGRGYIDYRTRRVLPGHTFALILATLLFVLVEAWGIWSAAHPAGAPRVPPQAWWLAWLITRLWILSAAAFFLDRYRVSTILVVGAALWLVEYVVRPFFTGLL